ncbi:hypothetical protein [Bifidobacterium xylocopae]|uniref:Uncharacterized protein n=1 Tax=Bifidobacterium xylocopae TaxID=2493119 RepID=A0A366KFA3_9BIFI|nr:hypothetical protein [Bifidobacterium xylocopae]RBP99878.1 hypothetical protein CRD59_02270 [Bifidobacterium xylocopae]
MDEKTLVDRLSKAETVDEIVALGKEAGKELSYEQADKLISRVMQTKNDAAELSGDTIEKIAKEVFGI